MFRSLLGAYDLDREGGGYRVRPACKRSVGFSKFFYLCLKGHKTRNADKQTLQKNRDTNTQTEGH